MTACLGMPLHLSRADGLHYAPNVDHTVKMEPYEIVSIDVPSGIQGHNIELGKRGAGNARAGYQLKRRNARRISYPTRGLIGLKTYCLLKRGTVIMNNLLTAINPRTK